VFLRTPYNFFFEHHTHNPFSEHHTASSLNTTQLLLRTLHNFFFETYTALSLNTAQFFLQMSTHTMAQTLIDNALEQTSLTLSQVAKRITTHGDLILSRWSKKSKDKLRSWLGAANSLPSWLQTSVLIEERMKLISLLHVRTTFSSEHWTAFDAIESGASFNKEKQQPSPFSSAYVLICGAYFGRVVGFELDAARNRTMLALPHALYIFKKQNELATALLAVVDAIVADASPSGNTKWLALVNTGLSGVGGRLDSYQDSAFSPPVNGLDTNALLQAALDKRDQMADEVELLQTDPEYTRDHVLALKADIRWDANVSPDIKWEHVASRFATEAISELNVWHDIVLTCEDLRTSCQNYESATTILAGEIIHPDNFHMLTVLRQLLNDSQRFQWEELYTAITQMHGMKDLYRMCSAGGKLVPVRKSVRPGAQETPSDRIHKAFCDLATAMNARYTSKSPQFNALLEQLAAVQFDKRAHRCLSTLIQLDALQLCVDWCQTLPPQWQAAGSGTHESFVASQSTSEDFFVEKRHTEIDPSRRDSYEILTAGQPHPKWKPLGPLLRAVCEHPRRRLVSAVLCRLRKQTRLASTLRCSGRLCARSWSRIGSDRRPLIRDTRRFCLISSPTTWRQSAQRSRPRISARGMPPPLPSRRRRPSRETPSRRLGEKRAVLRTSQRRRKPPNPRQAV
jgi:hypothetical protein